MKKRNQQLILIFFALLLVNLAFFFWGGRSSGVSFDEDLFVQDTTGVEGINIQLPEATIVIERTPEGWVLNEHYFTDEGLRRLVMSILQRVQVKKPVEMEPPANKILVSLTGERPFSFYVWGNPTKTKTFFSPKGRDEVYEVAIPGYKDYLGQIFELKPDQWRDRLVFNGSWRTIQELSLDYLGSDTDDFTIRFDESFFKLDELNEIDSTAVVDYLNQFQYFEVNEWISSGRFPRYDSLSKKPPIATLRIFTINLDEPVVFDIYPSLKNEPFHLVSDHNDNLMVIDQRRMLDILRKLADFKPED